MCNLTFEPSPRPHRNITRSALTATPEPETCSAQQKLEPFVSNSPASWALVSETARPKQISNLEASNEKQELDVGDTHHRIFRGSRGYLRHRRDSCTKPFRRANQ